MESRASRVLLVLVALVLLASGARAGGPCCPPSPAASPSSSPSPSAAQVFPSEAHGYRLTLPATWRFKPPTGPSDPADCRFELVEDPSLRGAYQVFEGAVTDDPKAWYEAAKKQYTDRAGSIPAIASIEVGPLDKKTLGKREAHGFLLETKLRDGPRYATLFVFVVRKIGVRVDVHELMFTGPVESFETHDQELDKFSSAVEWTPTTPGE